jgi:hypothetical protein
MQTIKDDPEEKAKEDDLINAARAATKVRIACVVLVRAHTRGHAVT